MDLYREVEWRGEIDYHRKNLPYLRESLRRCAGALPVTGFKELG